MQANPMRSLYGFAKQREEEANGLTQILGQVLGQNADLSGGRQLQPQLATHTPASQQSNVPPKIAFAGFGPSDQNNFNSHSKHDAAMSNNQSYIRTPSAENGNALARSAAANNNADMDAQKLLSERMGMRYSPALAPDSAIDTTEVFGPDPRSAPAAQPEAVDAATAPLMAPRAAAPENAKATIESILAGLGDNPEDAAKKAKNMSQGEMWLALGKGIGQIGKGQAVDISSVVQMRQKRLATSAAETKDVARRRAAASLVFEQSGDASMATAVGQGAISYSDFTTERQRKEVNARANAALVKEAQKNNLMAKIVGDMDFLSPEQKDLYAEATAAGVDLTTLMKPYELEQAADAAALATAKLDEEEQTRNGAIAYFSENDDPINRATAQYLKMDPKMSIEKAREQARLDFPTAETDDLTTTRKDYEYYLEKDVKEGETPIPFNFFRLQRDSAAGGNPINVVQNSNGEWVIANGAAPTAVAPAGATPPVQTGGVNLVGGPTVANAMTLKDATTLTDLNQAQLKLATEQQTAQFAGPQAEANLLATTQANALKAATAPLVVAQSEADLAATTQANTQATVMDPILTDTAVADLNAKLVQLDQDIATAPDNVARSGLEVEKLQTELEIMQSNQDLDVDIKKANLARLNQDLKNAAANFETAQTKVASAAKATSQTSALRRDNLYRLISDVYDTSLEFAGDDVLSGAYRDFMSTFFKSSDAGKAQGQIQGIDANNFIENLSKLKEQSPTGASGLGSASNIEGDRLVQLFGALQVGGDPATLRENLRAMANYALDYVHGTPDQIQAAVEAGEYDQSVGDIYGARWRIDGDPDKNDNQALVGDLGAITPLRYNTVPEFTVLNPQTPEDVAGATLEEADNTLTAIGLTPAQVDAMTIDQKRALSSEHQAIIMKWLEGN
jgi:hypothetical protein